MESPLIHPVSTISQGGKMKECMQLNYWPKNDKALNLWRCWILKSCYFKFTLLTQIKDKTSLFRWKHTERALLFLQGLLNSQTFLCLVDLRLVALET